MITNERQYRITRSEANRFERALAKFDDTPRDNVHPLLVKAEREAMASQLDELREEVAEYERLKSLDLSVISIASFDELAEGLIRARIAGGISQRKLAERLGLKEQQIQRYESERYASASYQRLRDIASAIGVRIKNDILLPVAPGNFDGLVRKLRQVSLGRDFLISRLLSSAEAAMVSGETDPIDEGSLTAKAGAALERVFGWTQANLFGAQPLTTPRFAAAEARFKMPARRDHAATSLYAAYANYLAVVALTGAKEMAKRPISDDPLRIRRDILDRYGDLSLRSIANHAWDLGIPVLPLRDAGAFHGACWRYEGRNVIILKQNSKHEARWSFDLLHELFHAARHPDADTLEVIEADETSAERRESDEEIAASQFAGDVVLDGRAEQLAEACVKAAQGSIERLKKIVPGVAASASVSVGALANYMAFRLSWQKINWWGAASNLQASDADPWAIVRDVLLARFPFAFDSDLDRRLLERSLS
jgi:Zn-dependent peptidase ImmA (M78 family)/transcriptional regulator with XRE-family HTH domain